MVLRNINEIRFQDHQKFGEVTLSNANTKKLDCTSAQKFECNDCGLKNLSFLSVNFLNITNAVMHTFSSVIKVTGNINNSTIEQLVQLNAGEMSNISNTHINEVTRQAIFVDEHSSLHLENIIIGEIHENGFIVRGNLSMKNVIIHKAHNQSIIFDDLQPSKHFFTNVTILNGGLKTMRHLDEGVFTFKNVTINNNGAKIPDNFYKLQDAAMLSLALKDKTSELIALKHKYNELTKKHISSTQVNHHYDQVWKNITTKVKQQQLKSQSNHNLQFKYEVAIVVTIVLLFIIIVVTKVIIEGCDR